MKQLACHGFEVDFEGQLGVSIALGSSVTTVRPPSEARLSRAWSVHVGAELHGSRPLVPRSCEAQYMYYY